VRSLALRLFGVLVECRPDLVGPFTAALGSRWHQETGSTPTAHEWIDAPISAIDMLTATDGDALVGEVVAAVQGKTRSDLAAVTSLPVLGSVLGSASGTRAVPGLLVNLRGQLSPATPDPAAFAIDVLWQVYEHASPSATLTGTPDVITALAALAALNQPGISPDAVHGLTRIPWPSEHVNAAISASSQFIGQLSSDDLTGILSSVSRAREHDVKLQLLADPLAIRMVEWLAPSAESDPVAAADLWRLLDSDARAVAACVLPGLIEEKKRTLDGLALDQQKDEVERWIRRLIARDHSGADIAGAEDSMNAVRELGSSISTTIITQLLEEWLNGSTAVSRSVWSLLLTSLDDDGREKVGAGIVAALTTGRDRVIRSLTVMDYWMAGTSPDAVRRVLDAANFAEWTRTWVLDERDDEVAQALRPVIDGLSPAYRSIIRDHVGRRPRDEARPAWDVVFGDRA
jgi:hypothetical protein